DENKVGYKYQVPALPPTQLQIVGEDLQDVIEPHAWAALGSGLNPQTCTCVLAGISLGLTSDSQMKRR
ncbi:hypothetical protein HAX54_025434, partial [Datura stramonium]|nr:hypothetical protein [Datura stramonium]